MVIEDDDGDNKTVARPLPNPNTLTFTSGVLMTLRDLGQDSSNLMRKVKEFYDIQPDYCFDGGNDKFFFSMKAYGERFFVAGNEINGLTIMLPNEY